VERTGLLLEQKMRGGVNGACGMNTTTPLKKNEKNGTEQCKKRDRPEKAKQIQLMDNRREIYDFAVPLSCKELHPFCRIVWTIGVDS